MNERKLRRFCTAILLAAAALRLLVNSGGAAARRTAQTQVWPVQILSAPAAESGPVPDGADASDPDELLPDSAETTVPPEPPVRTLLCFSDQEADAISISGACSYSVDKRALLTRPSTLTAAEDGPKVLIVHTHSSEAYTQEAGWEYDSTDPLRTGDPDRSVIRIGTRLAEILNEHGVETLHDTALNDYPSYSGAYERMRQTIERYLTQYPSIQMVLDIHRDAAEDAGGMPVSFTAEVNGARCAQLMFVVGTDEGGLAHPDWQENLANALKLQALTERFAPGLCRDLDLRTERFNQHETPGSLLVEFGCTGNTLAEALRSADYLGQALCTFWDSLGT